jgi:hypothetical protein
MTTCIASTSGNNCWMINVNRSPAYGGIVAFAVEGRRTICRGSGISSFETEIGGTDRRFAVKLADKRLTDRVIARGESEMARRLIDAGLATSADGPVIIGGAP